MNLLDRFLEMLGCAPTITHPSAKRTTPTCTPRLECLEDRCVPSVAGSSSIATNFNGTAIPAGDTLWFSSAFKVNGVGSAPVTLHFINDTISYTANGTSYQVAAPNANITLSPSAKTATTSFDAATNTWNTILPMKFSGNAFLDGVELQPTGGLPGGIKNVTWQGQFSSDTPGISINWQFATAVYTNFSSDYNALNVKPVDDNHVSVYQNSDHAGTPEAFLPYVVGGATGGGGSNYTGSLSATVQVPPTTLAFLSGTVTDNLGNPLAGVVLTLTTTNSQGQLTTVSVTTNSQGVYQFTGLQPGTYTLAITPPSGFQSGQDEVGTVNETSNGTVQDSTTISGICLSDGSVGSDYNFQEQFFGGSGG